VTPSSLARRALPASLYAGAPDRVRVPRRCGVETTWKRVLGASVSRSTIARPLRVFHSVSLPSDCVPRRWAEARNTLFPPRFWIIHGLIQPGSPVPPQSARERVVELFLLHHTQAPSNTSVPGSSPVGPLPRFSDICEGGSLAEFCPCSPFSRLHRAVRTGRLG